jgi:hypothetical protein
MSLQPRRRSSDEHLFSLGRNPGGHCSRCTAVCCWRCRSSSRRCRSSSNRSRSSSSRSRFPWRRSSWRSRSYPYRDRLSIRNSARQPSSTQTPRLSIPQLSPSTHRVLLSWRWNSMSSSSAPRTSQYTRRPSSDSQRRYSAAQEGTAKRIEVSARVATVRYVVIRSRSNKQRFRRGLGSHTLGGSKTAYVNERFR